MNELVVDEGLVRLLLRAQRPDLADREIRPVQGGWDNQMWRLGEDLAVRLPRTPRGPQLLEQEHRWLPELARRLPLPVPVPIFLGEPTDRFPKSWIVTTWVDGEPADLIPIADGRRSTEILADFLRALHQEAPADAPTNPSRTAPLGDFADDIERHLQAMPDADAAARAREVWAKAVAAEAWGAAPVWIHGDLHPANVVVAQGTLAGVIDFGDCCAGDPAPDLAAAWMLLPAGEAEYCFAAYAQTDEAAIDRARGWALLRGFGLIEIGIAGEQGKHWGKPTWKPAGEATLERVLA